MADTPKKELTEAEMEKKLMELRELCDKAEKEREHKREHNQMYREPVACCYFVDLKSMFGQEVNASQKQDNTWKVPPSFKKFNRSLKSKKQKGQKSHD